MVARDGLEPPTPAFSGPRSTTELSGLGIRLSSGIAKNHRASYFHLSPRPFQGSLPLAGNQQRKRILSIAIPRHTANSPLSRYPFSSRTPQGHPCCIASDSPPLHLSCPFAPPSPSHRLLRAPQPTPPLNPRQKHQPHPRLHANSAPSASSTPRNRARSNSPLSLPACPRVPTFTCTSPALSMPKPSSRMPPPISSASTPRQ